MWPILFGFPAGMITTIAGMGGGLVLLLALSAVWDPLIALAVTAPALLIGNGHRLWMYRQHAQWPIAGAIVLGALPGALIGGRLALGVPQWMLYSVMAGMCGLATAKSFGVLRWRPRRGVFTPVGAVAGVLTAGSGGAGLLIAPLLLSAGLTGEAYVATGAVCGVSMHLGRLVAYGTGGLVDESVIQTSLGLAVTIAVGNIIGARLRSRLNGAWARRAEIGALVAAMGLVIGGIATH